MPNPDQIEKLRKIKTLRELIPYLRDELDWPISSDDTDEITFDYSPEELGLNQESAVKIKEIKQLRPLHAAQPWGIFFVNFDKKKLPVVAMRRILRSLVIKKRQAPSSSERQAWQPHDLLFISACGEEEERSLTFAHFVENEEQGLAELRVLGWDDDDTPLHVEYVVRMIHDKLRWDESFKKNPDQWRQKWSQTFLIKHRHVIRTSEELAQALANVAKKIRTRIGTILKLEDGHGEMQRLHRSFKEGLIHDLDNAGFADMFAQTVTYGLFSLACRRTIPGEGTAFAKDDLSHYFTSPFLKEMLGIFLGMKSRKGKIDFDELGISDITDILTSPDTHMEVILADFNNKSRGEDPVIHFYEHFLSAYNKQLKIQRGVFYTPQPVVSYIVRSVHELLQTEFGLADGLADTTTWGEMLKKHPSLKLPPLTDEPGEKRTISPDEPFVQILDPATGTATFLVEVIDVIHRTLAAKWKQQRLTDAQQRAAWNDYVPQHLLPRLHAFELMMAPYAIAHMKIGLKLAETGYRFGTEERARIYLTNALEPWVKQLPLIGFDALAHEAAAVNEIKRHKRFTVVIGNPPYSNFGMLNKNPFILGLLDDYKRGLDEKKINLDDDFIKFVRFAEYSLARTRFGILGFITNSSYLDGVTHRQMRAKLLTTFNHVEVLNLHGSTQRGEANPLGGVDENVFDIMQGVAVGLFASSEGERVTRYADLWGSRERKYGLLSGVRTQTADWATLLPQSQYYFLTPKTFNHRTEYEAGIPLTDMFVGFQNGIKTDRDDLFFAETAPALAERIKTFYSADGIRDPFREEFRVENSSSYSLLERRSATTFSAQAIKPCLYRPFDVRFLYYKIGLTSRPAYDVMRHMLGRQNIGLLTCRQQAELGFQHVFVTKLISECCSVSLKTREITSLFPLYLAEDDSDAQRKLSEDSRVNFAAPFLKKLAGVLSLKQSGEHGLPAGLTPEDIFHYAYAVFYSPGYRSRYAEFLKIDFPRLPLTGNLELFRALARLGGELTALHLLESPRLAQPLTEFIGGRNPEVEKVSWSRDTVWVDKAQTTGFRGVREDVWNFHIGGYQVCEKWLKDRKGRTLTDGDLAHYHKIVVALSETIRLMAEIDEVIAKHGGWPGAFKPKE